MRHVQQCRERALLLTRQRPQTARQRFLQHSHIFLVEMRSEDVEQVFLSVLFVLLLRAQKSAFENTCESDRIAFAFSSDTETFA